MNGYPEIGPMTLGEIAAMFRAEIDRLELEAAPTRGEVRRRIALKTALLSLRVAMIEEEQG